MSIRTAYLLRAIGLFLLAAAIGYGGYYLTDEPFWGGLVLFFVVWCIMMRIFGKEDPPRRLQP